jgi:hypothetical protein
MPRPTAYDIVLPPRKGTLSPPPKVPAAIGEPQEELEKGEPAELGEPDRTPQALGRGRGSVLSGAERGRLAACGSRMFRSRTAHAHLRPLLRDHGDALVIAEALLNVAPPARLLTADKASFG